MDVEDRYLKIKHRWTNNGVLVREGFPVGVLAHGHVMWLLAEVEKLRGQLDIAKTETGTLKRHASNTSIEISTLRGALAYTREIAKLGAIGPSVSPPQRRALLDILAVIERAGID